METDIHNIRTKPRFEMEERRTRKWPIVFSDILSTINMPLRCLLIYSYDNDDMRSSKSHVTLLTLILLLTKRCSRNPRFKKRTRCHSFMAINRAFDVLAADWLSQTHVENYRNFSVFSWVTWLFSVEEVPIQYCSLYKK